MDKKRAWFIAILFFSGLCLTLYPFVSNLIAQSHASQAIAAYDEQVAEMDQEQIDAAKEAVRKYNEQLNAAVEASAMQGEDGISYLDLVDVGESIGFIEIPKIDVYLPIYSGTGEDVLQKGVGHLAESSYPIGGPVIADCPVRFCSRIWTSWRRAMCSISMYWMRCLLTR